MRENEKAHHMSVLKQQAYDAAMERIRDKVCDLITVIQYYFFHFLPVSLTLFLSPTLETNLRIPPFFRPSPVGSYLLYMYRHLLPSSQIYRQLSITHILLLTYNHTFEQSYLQRYQQEPPQQTGFYEGFGKSCR
jgi:hypothetical protein